MQIYANHSMYTAVQLMVLYICYIHGNLSHMNHFYYKSLSTMYSLFNPFMPCGLFYLKSLDRSISFIRDVWLVLSSSCFVEISELNSNKVNPDQMPRSVASDLGLHCLPMSLLLARLK